MRNRLRIVNPSRSDPAAQHVLMVFADIDLRVMVRGLCETLAPDCRLTDVAGVTDAVLIVLAEHVDVVLVDAQLAGDLLQSLVQHVRRTSPHARVSVFGVESDAHLLANQRLQIKVMPWTQLESTLMELLQVHIPPSSAPGQ